MKKTVSAIVLMLAFLSACYSQSESPLYCTVHFSGLYSCKVYFGVTEDSISVEEILTIKAALKKKHSFVDVVTTMAVHGWSYVDKLGNTGAGTGVILFRRTNKIRAATRL